MHTNSRFHRPILAALTFILIFFLQPVYASDAEGLKGWEIGSEYNSLYNAKELDRIRGKIIRFKKITPLPGMAPGTALVLDEGGGETILVHLCPASFASPKETGLRKGIKTKIRGSWAVIDDEDVFLASKAKQGEHFSFKVRLTKDGTPFWTMSPEELAREQASQ